MGSESMMTCRCLLLAALALQWCAASGAAAASEGSTEVSAGVAADADHHEAEWPVQQAGPGMEKRAYYVSEYKRLPVYNFGLGKRSPEPAANRYYAFGLGKRERGANGGRQYAFGLGKRPNNLYSFGLGKRSMEYTAPDNAFEDEDMMGEDLESSYDGGADSDDNDDDLSNDKRAAMDALSAAYGREAKRYSKSAYSFGLGKRAPKYSFGLGKRAPKYSFGLGKRVQPSGGGAAGRQYSFGLGKREISKDELRAVAADSRPLGAN